MTQILPQRTTSNLPLVFFFSGTGLPSYWRDSVAVSARSWDGPIILLTDCSVWFPPRGIYRIDFREWFDFENYETFCAQSPLDGEFRNGFWHKTILRFFVLQQFMEKFSVEKLLHLELDVPGFSLREVPGILDRRASGVFVPWLTNLHGVASLLYVNVPHGLDGILKGFERHYALGHEMAMLGAILREGKGVFGLPTSGTLAKIISGEPLPRNQIRPDGGLGVFDAAPLGHWAFGNDPRNQPGELVRNHFVFDYYDQSQSDLAVICPSLTVDKKGVVVLKSKAGSFILHCLHVHSKALSLVRILFLLRFMLKLSRRPQASVIPVIPRFGHYRHSKIRRKVDLALVRLKRAVTQISCHHQVRRKINRG